MMSDNGQSKKDSAATDDSSAAEPVQKGDQTDQGSDMGSDQGTSPQQGGGAYQDKTLTCRDCSKEFVWTAGEQEFYAQKGFSNPPGRCRVCRGKYKAARQEFGRVESKINCKKCGKESTVPFVPRDPNSVLCRECFQAERAGQ